MSIVFALAQVFLDYFLKRPQRVLTLRLPKETDSLLSKESVNLGLRILMILNRFDKMFCLSILRNALFILQIDR